MSFKTQVFNLQVLTRTEFENPQKSHFRPEKGHSLVYFNRVALLTGNLNFKLRIVFWNIFSLESWRFEKQITISEKEPPLLHLNYQTVDF